MEGGTWGGRHIQWVGGMYCEGAGQVGEWAGGWQVGEWRGWEHGCAVWFGVQEQCGWELWGRVGLHHCDAGVKYWEAWLRPASGGQALVARPGEAVMHPTAHILVTVH